MFDSQVEVQWSHPFKRLKTTVRFFFVNDHDQTTTTKEVRPGGTCWWGWPHGAVASWLRPRCWSSRAWRGPVGERSFCAWRTKKLRMCEVLLLLLFNMFFIEEIWLWIDLIFGMACFWTSSQSDAEEHERFSDGSLKRPGKSSIPFVSIYWLRMLWLFVCLMLYVFFF